MANENLSTCSTINGLNQEQGEGNVKPKDIEVILLERRTRRRMDLLSQDGVLREHGKIYRQLCAGELSPFVAEARSKVLGRHSKMIFDRDTIVQSEKLVNALDAPQNTQAQLPYFPDDDAASGISDDNAIQATA
jgi:hypothetical protein